MDAHESAEAWADEMLQYVATVRPDLPDEERELQWQSLARFRTLHFERVEASFEDSNKRGILFEALVLSDPRYPQRSGIEQQVGDYLSCSLWHNLFRVTAIGDLSRPDDIAVEVDGSTATVVGLVEVKLDITHHKVKRQLAKHVANLDRLGAVIEQYLSFGDPLPSCDETEWPKSVTSLVVPESYDRVLFKPALGSYVEIKGWQVLPALFSWMEVRVIADFLWHLREEAEPME